MENYRIRQKADSATLIFNLSVREEFLPDLDLSNITYIDHHKRSEKNILKFKNSKIIYKEYSSNSLT